MLTPIAQAATTTATEMSIHRSTTKALVSHLKKLHRNPQHNIAASGELASVMKSHFEALQRSGVNAKITDAIRSSTATPALTQQHLDKQFANLEALGVKFPHKAREYVSSQILQAATTTTPLVVSTIQSGGVSILKWQRTLHANLLKAQRVANGVSPANYRPKHAVSPLHTAGYEPGAAHFQRILLAEDYYYDGWADADTMMLGLDEEDGGYDPFMYDASLDGSYADAYTSSFDEYVTEQTYRTPSGIDVSLCGVWFTLVAMGSGSWAAGLAYLETQGAGVSLVLGSIALNPTELILILTIIAGVAAYLAIVC